jgi:hypothetical protein
MILSIALMFAGACALRLLIYFGAVCALPVAVGLWALNIGAGIGSVAVGLAASALVSAIGQMPTRWARSPGLRRAGDLPWIGHPVSTCRARHPIARLLQVFSVIGSVVVGCWAVRCLAALAIVIQLGHSRHHRRMSAPENGGRS